MTICIFCGKDIVKEYPIPVAQIHFQPILSGDRGAGDDILQAKYSCSSCHAKILGNAARAAQKDGELLLKEGKK
jgi:hypothetical protein